LVVVVEVVLVVQELLALFVWVDQVVVVERMLQNGLMHQILMPLKQWLLVLLVQQVFLVHLVLLVEMEVLVVILHLELLFF
jgi:hypothetical protein